MMGGKWRLALVLGASLGAGACASKDAPAKAAPQGPRVEAPHVEAPGEAAPMQKPATDLECTLSVEPRVRGGEPLMLRFRLTNRTGKPLYVLDWHTPLEGLFSRMLQVSRGGQDIPYQGPLAKRGNPGAEDYRELAPGASVEESIDVGLAYETQAPGRYRIAFPGPLMDVATDKAEVPRPLDKHQAMPVQCAAVETERLAP